MGGREKERSNLSTIFSLSAKPTGKKMGFLLNSSIQKKKTGLRLQKHPLLLFSKNQDALPRTVRKAGGNEAEGVAKDRRLGQLNFQAAWNNHVPRLGKESS